MFSVRIVKTSSGANAVQIVYYYNRKRMIFKHIGSANNVQELESLKIVAQDIINNHIPELPFIEQTKFDNLLYLDKSEFLGVYYGFLYQGLTDLIKTIGFDKIKQPLLLDLVIIRIVEPASKLRSIELLNDYFGIKHRRQLFYESVSKWLELKKKASKLVLEFAKEHYNFNFDILFYDVTTLYFETFEQDDLRKNGFSKDNKSQQPQILVALMVTKEGFPISYEIFAGNTFEGHTIIPVITKFIEEHSVKEFTVVADAAMISDTNVEALKTNNINYIVGGRLGNISENLFNQIDLNITREDGNNIRIKTDKGYLICSYSSIRYRKDKYEMEKQIKKAEDLIKTPSKSKKTKFTKTTGTEIELNQGLINKTKKLLGIKGYYTNIEQEIIDNQTIISRYHELYKIEQAFRIAKSDLKTRPIYHFKEEPIKLHLLICFMALVLSKHIELSTGDSIKKFISNCKMVTDARMLNNLTNKEIRIRTKYNDKILKYIKDLNLSH
jgi:transposase